jgi:hypothetical protein
MQLLFSYQGDANEQVEAKTRFAPYKIPGFIETRRRHSAFCPTRNSAASHTLLLQLCTALRNSEHG